MNKSVDGQVTPSSVIECWQTLLAGMIGILRILTFIDYLLCAIFHCVILTIILKVRHYYPHFTNKGKGFRDWEICLSLHIK